MFDNPSFKDTELLASNFRTEMTFGEFEQPIDFVHKAIMGEWLVWLLMAGDALAAMYHHFVKHGLTLPRMMAG